MAKFIFLINALGVLLAFPSSASDGGSSVAGPGGPQFDWGCYETNYVFQPTVPPEFQVSVGRFYPAYQLELTVIDYRNGVVITEKLERSQDPAVGSPIVYQGETYRLEINPTTTPMIEDGKVYSHAKLYHQGTLDRELKCE